jgi:D-alanyl-D-alanine carboxypeptidase (penicillin-binding protein 5/6)
MFKPGDVVEGAEVIMGIKETVPVTVSENVLVTVPVAVRNDLKAQIIYKGPLVAPVKKGDAVGILRVTVPRMGTHEYPVVAAEDMPALGLFAGTITKLRMMIGGSDSVR